MGNTDSSEHSGQHFKDIDFANPDLVGHSFEECTFTKCRFLSSEFTRARFLDCKFEFSELSNSKWANARLRDSFFVGCKMIGIQWVQTEDLSSLSFEDCNLAYSNFTGLKLKKVRFFKCRLNDSDLSQTDLSESDLRESDFLNVRFNQTRLLKADLRGAVNYLINPMENVVKSARFSMPEAQGLLYGLGIRLD